MLIKALKPDQTDETIYTPFRFPKFIINIILSLVVRKFYYQHSLRRQILLGGNTEGWDSIISLQQV